MACVIITALAVGRSLLESYRSTPVLFHIIFFSGQRLFHCLMLHVPGEMAVSFGLKITQQFADRFPMRSFAPAYTYTSLPCIQMRTTRKTAHPFKGHRQHVKLMNGERILYRPQLASCCCKFYFFTCLCYLWKQ